MEDLYLQEAELEPGREDRGLGRVLDLNVSLVQLARLRPELEPGHRVALGLLMRPPAGEPCSSSPLIRMSVSLQRAGLAGRSCCESEARVCREAGVEMGNEEEDEDRP